MNTTSKDKNMNNNKKLGARCPLAARCQQTFIRARNVGDRPPLGDPLLPPPPPGDDSPPPPDCSTTGISVFGRTAAEVQGKAVSVSGANLRRDRA